MTDRKRRAHDVTISATRELRHDLRTPINQIIGYGEMLEEEARDAGLDRLVPDLQKIGAAARLLAELIDRHVRDPKEPGFSGTTEQAQDGAGGEPPVETTITLEDAPARSIDGGASLLVVDDNEMNRDMLSRRLRKRGYVVETAEDGYRTLEMVAEDKYDLILLDIMMPGISGLDVLKTLREKYSVADLPIIMATAKDQSEDTVLALNLGANDYVTKPLDMPVVLARVETQLSLKRAMQEIRRLAEELERRNQFIRRTFGRYLSDDVVAELLETPAGLTLGGEKRVLTLLMSDLRGFTSVSERLTPEQVVRLLNRFLGAMTRIIAEHKGTIDEFIGDAILALFGAPTQRADDARRAVACAIEMQQAMARINEENERDGLPSLQMGIAVNTGEVVVGNIGSETRAKYGVVGSPVNLTARIESCTLGGQVFISQSCLEAAGADVEVGARMTMDVKGVQDPITFHELLGVTGSHDMRLPRHRENFTAIAEPASLTYAVLEGKHVAGSRENARLVRLAENQADIAAERPPAPLTNLRIRFFDHEGNEIQADLYAKVLAEAGSPEIFRIGFTSVPPEIESFLDALRSSAAS
ncbi:MAG: response regulator [Vicinamibacteria bacterium]|nr:response regulator [Vicinamibacteria bacterium]